MHARMRVCVHSDVPWIKTNWSFRLNCHQVALLVPVLKLHAVQHRVHECSVQCHCYKLQHTPHNRAQSQGICFVEGAGTVPCQLKHFMC